MGMGIPLYQSRHLTAIGTKSVTTATGPVVLQPLFEQTEDGEWIVVVDDIPRASFDCAYLSQAEAARGALTRSGTSDEVVQAVLESGGTQEWANAFIDITTRVVVPAEQRPGRARPVASFATAHRHLQILIAGTLTGFGIGLTGLLPQAHSWSGGWYLASYVACTFVAVLCVHEAGHALAALRGGIGFHSVTLGLTWWVIPAVWLRVPQVYRLKTLGRALVWAAGPGANLIVAALLSALVAPSGARNLLVAGNLFAAGANLLPWRGRDGFWLASCTARVSDPWTAARNAGWARSSAAKALMLYAVVGLSLCGAAVLTLALTW
jgi:hypothetical protein